MSEFHKESVASYHMFANIQELLAMKYMLSFVYQVFYRIMN